MKKALIAKLRRSKRLRIVLTSISMLTAGLFVGAPAVEATTCVQTQVTIYELANGTGDRISFCTSKSTLRLVTHTQTGYCDVGGAFRIGDSWMNCMSSFRIVSVAAGCGGVGLFTNESYGGELIGGRYYADGDEGLYNVSGLWNNALDSIYLAC